MQDDLRQQDIAHLWRPYTDIASHERGETLCIERGEGVYLVEAGGRRILDGISSWWCVSLGHGERRIIGAIQAQAARLQHSILGTLGHAPAIELAARLAALTGGRLPHVYFASDGSSVVDAALKMAAQYWALRGRPEKKRFIALEEAYHGDTLGAIGVGYTSWFQGPYGGLVQPALQAPSPWTPEMDPAAQLAHARAAFEELARTVRARSHELAALVLEPLVQAAGGIRIYPPEYLQWARALCDECGLLLIADEIATGFWRTGPCFACEAAGITPDIMLVGKALTGGYLPMSALLATGAIYSAFRAPGDERVVFWDGHTFTGNPICAAAALAALDCYAEDDIGARMRPAAAALADGFARLGARPEIAGHRALGMIAMCTVREDAGGAITARRACEIALQNGLFTRPLGAVLYLWPPLSSTPSEIGAMCGISRGRHRRGTSRRLLKSGEPRGSITSWPVGALADRFHLGAL
jgi:adenosylmethionine-8-amino-7-oxononanoate aminotransferase